MATEILRSSGALAMEGGAPIRTRPWPEWPDNSLDEWESVISPALKEVYLSKVEGLPGIQAERFGGAMAEYCGSRYGLMMPHGTDAIAAAISGALDLDGFRAGGEILLPNYTFVASASAPLDVRCTLGFVDIDPKTYTMSPEAAEAAIRPGVTVALLPVHLAGHPADMDALNALAKKYGLKVIEDCAQAHGAEVNGKKVGSLGDAGAFSFQSSKNLTSGEGGAVVTDDLDVYHRVCAFSNVGRVPGGARWEYPRLGWNYRPSEYLAALLLTRLPRLEEQTRRRNENAAYLSSGLSEIEGIEPSSLAPWATMHGYHLYIFRYDPSGFGGHPREDFLRALSAEGISCSSGYGSPLSEEGGMKRVRDLYPELIRVEPCPNVIGATQETVWLYQNMLLGDKSDMDDILEATAKIQKAFRR